MQQHRYFQHAVIQPVTGFRLRHTFLSFMYCLMGCLFFSISTATAGANKISIVTDIAPIHSLTSMVVGQQANVELLIPPSQSPHGFSLKPSQIRSINQAAAVITLSHEFTPALSRHLKAIDNSAIVLQLSDSNDKQLTKEHGELKHTKIEQESNVHNNKHTVAQRNGNNAVMANTANEHVDSEHIDDVHTWLNPENAIVWIDRIANTLIQLDGENAILYESNARHAKTNLTAMHKNFAAQLKAVQSAHYIVYHDAYQHFAHSYGLQKPISIALSDARAPGAKKLRTIRAEAKRTKCVFSEVQHDDIIVDTITAGLQVNRATLDPIGSTIPIGPDHYPQLMQALVNEFVDCLNG